ncbi:MAG TPA: biotin--[acetyl-CoA-carboxylase] ligase [Ilumatobacteraceae bacterium]|nr:biotin--[acetyl-CoA-carboxylase] ligase [Ilumatobacteraceae bacterium]
MADADRKPPDRPWPDGWIVTHVPVTGSTNEDLLAAAAVGAPDRSVLVADHQTAGRGRLDRRWEAPPGVNLLVSILFRTVPTPASILTQRVGLAAIDACRAAAGVEAVLKWPNDLLVDERKLAGILAQRAADGSIVVGLGLNVGWAPTGAASLRGAASLDSAASRIGEPTPLDMLAALLTAFDSLPDDIGDRYRAALATLGRRVDVQLPGGRIDGRAVDIDGHGRLIVIDSCGLTHRLDVGDVVHVRDAGPPA